jgi:hypothetical protein
LRPSIKEKEEEKIIKISCFNPYFALMKEIELLAHLIQVEMTIIVYFTQQKKKKKHIRYKYVVWVYSPSFLPPKILFCESVKDPLDPLFGFVRMLKKKITKGRLDVRRKLIFHIRIDINFKRVYSRLFVCPMQSQYSHVVCNEQF